MRGLLEAVADLMPNLGYTVTTGALGYGLGLVVAAVVVVGGTRLPSARRRIWPALGFVFAIPIVLVAPILGTALGGLLGTIVLVSLFVYYIVSSFVFRDIDNCKTSWLQLCDLYQASFLQRLRLVWSPHSLSGLAAGATAAIPTALLAAIVGDMFGNSPGLGARLVSIVQTANRQELVAFVLVCTSLAIVGASIVSGATLLLPARFRSVFDSKRSRFRSERRDSSEPGLRRTDLIWTAFLGIVVWEAAAWLVAERVFFKGPAEFLDTVLGRDIAFWRHLGSDVWLTVWRATLGVILAAVGGLSLAGMARLSSLLGVAVQPVVLVTQVVPMVALVPFVVLVFGGGSALVIGVCFFATFYLMYAASVAGLEAAPENLRYLANVYGASRLKQLLLIEIPHARPFVLEGLRLTLPRMIAGAVLAEYLVTGDGLGGIVYQHRATDFGALWIVAFLSSGVGVVLAFAAGSLFGLRQRVGPARSLKSA